MKTQTADELTAKKCQACEGGVDPYSADDARAQLGNLEGWSLADDAKWIRKKWKAKNFVKGMEFLNAVAEIAEDDQHHPDVHLTGYQNVKVELTTHAIGGLSENDFILAAKIDRAAEKAGVKPRD